MTDPFRDLSICLINFLCGIFFFIIYYGILKIENKRNKYLVYVIDFLSVLLLGIIYLFVIDSNEISFHLYDLIFISLGYYLGFLLFRKQLDKSYNIFFILFNFLFNKFTNIFKWCFDIIPIIILKNKIKKIIFKYKLKKALKKLIKQKKSP